ncbi:50S ribosomal protein L23 [Candidatus Venteria ishoeyi]|nr:50S ribosomal protein L23 [Candidatus Venteria ishoeyi]MDM8545902.1 50S ribosomal protein L23 [Candidatus Venteria ishoeyi]
MDQARLMEILLSPRVSEKAMQQADKDRQFVFKVASDATKQEVKQAVELLFEVKVNSVQTVVVKGKRKTFGRIAGKRVNWKKAYVCLQEGYDIDFGTE